MTRQQSINETLSPPGRWNHVANSRSGKAALVVKTQPYRRRQMTKEHLFLALDLGAESGRGELVTLKDSKVSMREIHRFPNKPVRLMNTLHWNVLSLYDEIVATLRAAGKEGQKPISLSVDTWGVDFGLLGKDGKLLGNPVHYRDGRTEGIHNYSNRFMSLEDIYRATGCEPWTISSLFQLLSMQRDGSPLLEQAGTFLNMPDLFNYFLTGQASSELSIANTSNLLGTDCHWSTEVMDAFSLDGRMFPKLVEPGTIVGPLTADLAQLTDLGEVPVIATCGHDTSAAVAAIPGEGEDWAFLSCGTWSIVGRLIDHPITSSKCLKMGFTNEYTVGGWFLARNILGLWLVQELRKKWHCADDGWDYPRMTAEAASAESGPLINAGDPSLLAPADMEQAILDLLAGAGDSKPPSRGQLVRCVLESLALEYDMRLRMVSELTGKSASSIYMVGGGVANKLLCQLTANACGLRVYAGCDQCTALGNALTQALAQGILKNPQEIRDVMRRSFDLTVYQPAQSQQWEANRQKYADLVKA